MLNGIRFHKHCPLQLEEWKGLMPYCYDLVPLARIAASVAPEKRMRAVELQELVLSKREETIKAKPDEVESFVSFISVAMKHGITRKLLRGFVYSYTIPRLGQEFDLLKLADNLSIDIELKSEDIGEEGIAKQLREHKYYLDAVAKTPTRFFSYVSDTQILREYVGNSLIPITWDDLASALGMTGKPYLSNYDVAFSPSKFLVSPINDTERFVAKEYFLNPQQENVKRDILRHYETGEPGGFILCGGAGTGKTLLLYDIARTMARERGGKACVIHCGPFSDIHGEFNRRCSEIDLLVPKYASVRDFTQYCFVGIDEAHRIYTSDLNAIIDHVTDSDKAFVVSIDPKQTVSKREEGRNIISELTRVIPKDRLFALKGKIRANDAIHHFVSAFFDNGAKADVDPRFIHLSYVRNLQEAKDEVALFESMGYQYINLSGSSYSDGVINDYCFSGISAHKSIGQEFDKVVVALPDVFYLDKGRLCSDRHPVSDYITHKLLYEAMTRARERLAVVFVGNLELYMRALRLFGTDEDRKQRG